MSDIYLIPQFIVDYLQKSKSVKSPQKLATTYLRKYKTPEIEKWFKENEVMAGYLWKFFVFYGLDRFSFRECPECGKRIKIDTILDKPDVKYCSYKCQVNSEEFKEKRKQTWLEKYGVENPFQNKEVQEKIKQTNLEKYGVEHISQSKKSKEQHRLNHWETFCSLLKERNIVPLFSKEEYINDTGRNFRCLVCEKDFVSEGANKYMLQHKNKDGSYTTLIPYAIFCPHCFKAPYSQKEKEVLEYVKSIYDGEVLENDRKILEGKELDIFIPSLNLGIEFDGDYWHSKEGAKEKDERKNRLCEERGIKLLRIKEEDWDNNKENVKEEIKFFLSNAKQ